MPTAASHKTSDKEMDGAYNLAKIGAYTINVANGFFPESHAYIPRFILLSLRYNSLQIHNSRQISLKIET
jgi:hypothetical protein